MYPHDISDLIDAATDLEHEAHEMFSSPAQCNYGRVVALRKQADRLYALVDRALDQMERRLESENS